MVAIRAATDDIGSGILIPVQRVRGDEHRVEKHRVEARPVIQKHPTLSQCRCDRDYLPHLATAPLAEVVSDLYGMRWRRRVCVCDPQP